MNALTRPLAEGEAMTLVPTAFHVGLDEIPWVQNPSLDSRMRLLQIDADAQMSVTHGLMAPGLAVGTHRHRGPVQMWTMSGSWMYRENDFVNRAGSYLYEPIGSVHTLVVPADNDGPTEVLSIVYGDVEYLDADGNVLYVSNWKRTMEQYYEGCEQAGLARPNTILR
jgi:2,4'-dihydroxyacetophenone dioxygenase